MARFGGVHLPAEIVTMILKLLETPHDFAVCSLVSKELYTLAIPELYRHLLCMGSHQLSLLDRTLTHEETQPMLQSLTGRKPLGSLIRTFEFQILEKYKPGIAYQLKIDEKDEDEVSRYAARVIKRSADGLIYMKARYNRIDYHWLQEVKYCKALSCLNLQSFTFMRVTYADILHVVEHLDSLEVLLLPDPEPEDFEELATHQTKIPVKWPTNIHHITCSGVCCPEGVIWSNWPTRLTSLNYTTFEWRWVKVKAHKHRHMRDFLSNHQPSLSLRYLDYTEPMTSDCDHETEAIQRVFPNITTLFIHDLLHNGLLRRFIYTDAMYPMTDMFLDSDLDDQIVAELSLALSNGLRNLRQVYFRHGHVLDRRSSQVREMVLATHAVLKKMAVRRLLSSNAVDGPTQHDESETGAYLYDRQDYGDTGRNTVTVIYGWSFDGSRFQLSDALNGFSDWELQRHPLHHYLRW